MQEEKLISVIVPVYNVKDYIKKCVQSIIEQSYKNLEIILVDDGSTDGSAQICDEIGKIDDRIVVLHKKNGGLSDARNYGIDHSQGEFLSFIDSDDYIHPDMYKNMLNRMHIDNSNLCLCNYMKVDENGEKTRGNYSNFNVKDSIISDKDMIKGLESSDIVYFVIACNKLYRKSLFENVRYPAGKIHEDEYVAHLIAHNARMISCISEPYYFYLQRTDSITHGESSKSRKDKLGAFVERFDYIRYVYSDMTDELIWILADYVSYLANEIVYSYNKEFFDVYKKMFSDRFRYILTNSLFECKVSSRFIKCCLFFMFPKTYCRMKAFQMK